MSNECGGAKVDFDEINFDRRELRDIGCETIDFIRRKVAAAGLTELQGRIMINTAKRNFADMDTILIFRECIRRGLYGKLQPSGVVGKRDKRR